jgi:hypothetical protein
MGKKAIVAAALAAVVVLALLFWIAGEAHYRNCLTETGLRYPVAESGAALDPGDAAARDEALADCSRWP